MVKKMINMESGADILLLEIYDIARETGLNSTYVQKLIDDPTIETPQPAFKFGSRELWTTDVVETFKKLAEVDAQNDAGLTFTKGDLIERAEKRIKAIGAGYYERKIDYREAYNQAQAIYSFINSLSQFGIPDPKATELWEVIRKLKNNAGLYSR